MISLKSNYRFVLYHRYSKGISLIFVSLLLVTLLFTACFVSVFSGFSLFVSGVDVTVSDQNALRAAVAGAPSGLRVSYVIALSADISLTGSLVIPAGKNITLTNAGGVICSLIALVNNVDTIVVNGVLVLDGITVTHANNFSGNGVTVNEGGTFIMNTGEISGNTASGRGGGVYNNGGVFEMHGGRIINNTASEGGGVYNSGSFRLFNGVISSNTASFRGGGVFGGFTMFGGKISGNNGVGVHIIWPASFNLFGGEISFNTNGGVFLVGGFFNMTGGVISNNTAIYSGGGGGVWLTGTFTMTGGVISGNSATSGGGVYVGHDVIGNTVFYLLGGEISNNVALDDGGGVWVELGRLDRLFVSDGVVFSNNRASAAYNRDSIFDYVYNSQVGRNVVWSSPFTQGYNNYDVSFVYGESITKYVVDVCDSYATSTGSGSYSVGAVVTVNAGTRDGYTFSGWTVNEGSVTMPNSNTATFAMPANKVVITANWHSLSTNSPTPTNSPSNPSTNPPTPSNPLTNPPTPNNSVPSGGGTVFPSYSDKGNLLSGYFGYMLLVVCVVLVVVGVIGVLLHKRSKT